MAARNKKWQPGIKMAEKGSKNFSRFMRHFPTTYEDYLEAYPSKCVDDCKEYKE